MDERGFLSCRMQHRYYVRGKLSLVSFVSSSFSTHTQSSHPYWLLLKFGHSIEIRQLYFSKIQRNNLKNGVNITGFNLDRKSQEFYDPTLIEFFFHPYCNLTRLSKGPLLWHITGSFEMQVKWDTEATITSTHDLQLLFDLASSEEKEYRIKLNVPAPRPLIIQLHRPKGGRH